MRWGSAAEFLAMGGYGLYVWGSVSMTIVVVLLELFLLGQRRNSAMSRIKRKSIIEGNDVNEKPT